MAPDVGIVLLAFLLVVLIATGARERQLHQRNIDAIPHRVIVNGTRGKSSVTRLIGAGLRAGGANVFAKTTGTKPCMIINNQEEVPVVRLGRANIREQIGMYRQAVRRRADVVVFENMSLRPDLQFMEESRLVQPQIVVITNVRADHLDVMGPTVRDIAHYFVSAVPRGAHIVTAEKDLYPLLAELAERKGVSIEQSDETEVLPEEMKNFPYQEHRENVALALRVCARLGVARDKALEEMYRYIPDPGVLRRYELVYAGKRVALDNALAANDPDSTYLIHTRMTRTAKHFYVLINCRADRIDRSLQMADMVFSRIPAERYLLTGGNTQAFVKRALKLGMTRERMLDLGGREPERAAREILETVADDSLIFAIGNIVGYGEALVKELIKVGTP